MSTTLTTAPDRPKATPRAYRFDARLNQKQKLLIQRAADMEGRSMTDFVLQSAEQAAERTIEQHFLLTLTARDSVTFVDAILKAPKPGKVLRRAVQHYRKVVGG